MLDSTDIIIQLFQNIMARLLMTKIIFNQIADLENKHLLRSSNIISVAHF